MAPFQENVLAGYLLHGFTMFIPAFKLLLFIHHLDKNKCFRGINYKLGFLAF